MLGLVDLEKMFDMFLGNKAWYWGRCLGSKGMVSGSRSMVLVR